jgi:hypothetical protein
MNEIKGVHTYKRAMRNISGQYSINKCQHLLNTYCVRCVLDYGKWRTLMREDGHLININRLHSEVNICQVYIAVQILHRGPCVSVSFQVRVRLTTEAKSSLTKFITLS